MIDAFFKLPDFGNKFYLIRAIRLSLSFFACFVFIDVFEMSAVNGYAFFLGLLITAISDRSRSFQYRIRFSFSLLISIFALGLVEHMLEHFSNGQLIFIPFFVFIAYLLSFRFAEGNFFFSALLLSYSFMLPISLDDSSIWFFLAHFMLGGLWFIITMVFGFSVYLYFYEKKEKREIAKLFFIDHSTSVFSRYQFFVKGDQAKRSLLKELDGKLLTSHPFRLVISLLISFIVMDSIHQNQSYWIMLTVVLIHNPSHQISAGLPKIFQRLLGTSIGLLFALPLVLFQNMMGVDYILIAFSAFMIFISIRDNYFFAVIFITLLVMTSMHLENQLTIPLYLERLIDTGIAIAIVLGVHLCIVLAEKAQQLISK